MPKSNNSITVLVVDDEKIIRNLLGETLGALGYATLTAEDYDSAVSILSDERVDVVITDIMLPGKTGIDLTKHIKSEYPKVPVLAISGKNVPRQAVIDAGANGFLAKPFRFDELELRVTRVLRSVERMRAQATAEIKEAQHDESAGFTGNLAKFGVSALLVMMEMERSSGVLVIRSDTTARIFLRRSPQRTVS